MKYGDARAAIVVCEEPLLVAAYSDTFDAILVLRFPEKVAQDLRFARGQRLISVNAYGPGSASDVRPGPLAEQGPWGNFVPTIVEIFSEDAGRIRALHETIHSEEWARCAFLISEWMTRRRPAPRSGLPLQADVPAE